MKRIVVFCVALLCAFGLCAGTNAGFGLDAFNRAVSASVRANAVFSPFSFEIDSVIFCEAVDALSRAKLSETMGVFNGLESTYHPLYEMLTATSSTNFLFRDARGFCLSDERMPNPVFHQWLQRTFFAEAFAVSSRVGAECWFRARMDGAMEDFSLPVDIAKQGVYSYYDLVSFRSFWTRPFPLKNTHDIRFRVDANTEIPLPAMSDWRMADVLKRKSCSILRLPLSADTHLFVFLPNQNLGIRELRSEFGASKILDCIHGFNSVSDFDISHGPAYVVMPKMDITYEADLKLPFEYFRFPTHGLQRLQTDARSRYLRQRMRFQLDESGSGRCAPPPDRAVQSAHDDNRFVLDKPFLFFVYHDASDAILVAGQFTGR